MWENTWAPWRLKNCMCWMFSAFVCVWLYTCLLYLSVGGCWPVSGCVSQWPITKPPNTPVYCTILPSHSKRQIRRLQILLSYRSLNVSSLQWLIKFRSASLKAVVNYIKAESLQYGVCEKREMKLTERQLVKDNEYCLRSWLHDSWTHTHRKLLCSSVKLILTN